MEPTWRPYHQATFAASQIISKPPMEHAVQEPLGKQTAISDATLVGLRLLR